MNGINTNYLLVYKGCPYCLKFIKAVRLINMKLPVEKRIQVIDCWEYTDLGVILEPIIEKFKKDGLNEGYPLCYLSGVVVEPANPETLRVYLNKFLEDDII